MISLVTTTLACLCLSLPGHGPAVALFTSLVGPRSEPRILAQARPQYRMREFSHRGISDDQIAGILSAASYVGAAAYCISYGVDYLDLSREVSEGLEANTDYSDDDELFFLQVWQAGYRNGELGRLYSVELQGYVDIWALGDPVRICAAAHQQALTVSRMK